MISRALSLPYSFIHHSSALDSKITTGYNTQILVRTNIENARRQRLATTPIYGFINAPVQIYSGISAQLIRWRRLAGPELGHNKRAAAVAVPPLPLRLVTRAAIG